MRHFRCSTAVGATTVFLLLVGCSGSGDRPPQENAGTGGEVREAGAVDPAEDRPVCLEGEGFVADGAVPVAPQGGGDAAAISDLRWQRHDGCERFVIDLSGDGGEAATSAGAVSVDVRRELGVVRVDLREVEQVDREATDAGLDGPLARAAYAVRSPEGRWLYVDLHLAEAAEARAMVLEDPARVVVDLRPGGESLPPAPATHQRVVVLEPRPGPASYPLTVTGYARTFEANVVARLEHAGRDVRETFTTATGWAEAWGHFTMTIDDGPPGAVTLHVGEHSARDGTWEGAAVELEMQ